MNKKRKQTLAMIKIELISYKKNLQRILDEEQKSFDNMPENLQLNDPSKMVPRSTYVTWGSKCILVLPSFRMNFRQSSEKVCNSHYFSAYYE